MKKNLILGITLFVVSTVAFAQDAEYKRQKIIYRQALAFNDPDAAKMALYNMIALKPGNIGALDSLSLLYFEQQNWVSAGLVALEAKKLNPNNLLAMEIAATSFENLGLLDKALEQYEPLYLKNNDINVLYKIAFMQYRLKRYNDAVTSADIVLKDPKAKELNLVFGKSDNTNQQVSMEAACYRLKGLIAYDKGDKPKAINLLEKALEIAPDFEAVQNVLAEAKK